jgi:uncharacterized protein YjeT (DUF2065 family)
VSDLVVGIGLVLVIEGLIWALAPAAGMRMLAAAASTPQQALRLAGLASVAVGVALVWLIRG